MAGGLTDLPATGLPAADLWRRLAAVLVAAGLLLCLPAVVLGPAPAMPLLRAAWPLLSSCWGDGPANAWGRAVLAVVPAPAAPPGALAELGVPGARRLRQQVLASLPQSFLRLRSWPLRVASHLCALALWLGLLHPLAWSVYRWRRRATSDPDRQAACPDGCGLRWPVGGRLLAPPCVSVTLVWHALPTASLAWAPLAAAAWLALWCRLAVEAEA